ncbi:hypothetical protein K435DRAFT_775967 [Dendrothele bispora CBS 962.96]|uniref:Protein kinase domain-containing protein n=1 Tax=Dendrothele bispora (strain CBS 962.96) TaxID=1314807 RepID=A0A4S8MGB5_DENBC|nr:hypothetical protein K435DRAFT_775967 [Dendrothele bispora CBS 962.96]
MNNRVLRVPRAPTEQLCIESTKILAKLELIVEFRPWLNWTRYLLHRKYKDEPPLKVLFDCFALGASLGVLLDLLGSPAPSHLSVDLDKFDFHLELSDREKFFSSFIQRVGFLEMQGKLRYGEVLRVEDLFGGTSSGFMKGLKTVQRVLDALQATYPGLYELPDPAYALTERKDNILELVITERAHVSYLQSVLDLAAELSCTSRTMQTTLDPLVINNNRLRQYHDHVLKEMECLLLQQQRPKYSADSEDWLRIFKFDNDFTRSNISASYRSLAMNYLDIVESLKEQVTLSESTLSEQIQTLLSLLSIIPSRIAEYCDHLQAVLDWTLPPPLPASSSVSSTSFFNHLCTTLYHMSEISSAIDEMSWQIRGMQASRILQRRAFYWKKDVDPTQLGILLLDDHLKMDSGRIYQVFLFETTLLCCLDEKKTRPGPMMSDSRKGSVDPGSWASWYDWTRSKWSAWGSRQAVPSPFGTGDELMMMNRHAGHDNGPGRKNNARQDSNEEYAIQYPIPAWEMGPALQRRTPLNLVHAIPTSSMRRLVIHGKELFSFDWTDQGDDHTLRFCCSCVEQKDQWCRVLEGFAQVFDASEQYDTKSFTESISDSVFNLTDIDLPNIPGRRFSHPRPWSLIGRKGRHSESSSLHQQKIFESTELLLSPDILPKLFSPKSRYEREPMSPVPSLVLEENVRDSGVGLMSPIEMPQLWKRLINDPKDQKLADLTGQISKTGRFPEAHGGFADVWRGVWKQNDGQQKTVAVKVLRSRIGDPEKDKIVKKRLSHELAIWKQLDHPNVVPLYGTVSDFGIYPSMVCPWLENGSVTRYLEKCGDILSMTDRLQFLVEVAEGLAYLHSYDVVHGDLTGANILIDDEHKARLCDFGLSSIMANFEASNMFSAVSGAIRWADASLYKLRVEAEDEAPKPTTRSDIYSFGSVTLEILSGRIPYHYVRNDAQVIIELHKGNKPRRPAALFVTDMQWAFIQKCWHDVPDQRPTAMEVLAEVKELHKASLEHRRWTS